MHCDECGSQDAVLHIRQIKGDEVMELHLCESCARKKGIAQGMDSEKLTISEILTGLLSTEPDLTTGRGAKGCPVCGLSLQEFKRSGLLGCADCFQAFDGEIRRFVKKLGAGPRHRGRLPGVLEHVQTKEADMERLRSELDEAVRGEDYEKAAQIRDRIRTMGERRDA